ncbi:MAG: DUF3667 domain-containing protein [Bacteroidetes bacterium]|nr:DUF3667 domain-containing protein [Bacteroidota bacterium]
MSHLKERSEKKCLNCGASLYDRYCHACGQENLEPQESVWHLLVHVFNDFTHFDGKFFSTLKYIIRRPGFLSTEYMLGRRNSYLNPVRMYLFTSAIFFLLFFTVKEAGSDFKPKRQYNGKTIEQVEKMNAAALDSFTRRITGEGPLTLEQFKRYADSISRNGGIHFASGKFNTREEYDSLVKAGKEEDGWFLRKLAYKEIEMKEKYNGDQDKLLAAFVSNLIHSFPKILFLSLPLFAFVLWMLYRRQKEFYYVSHAIFTIHFYIFDFIIMFAMLVVSKIMDWFNSNASVWINIILILLCFFYLYKAMRKFYRQGRGKTILKFLLATFSWLFIIAILFVIFIFFSILKM